MKRFFVVECPLLQGCYTQGKTLDEALKNIHEVIELCLEEQKEEIVALRSSTSCYDETNYGGCLGIYSDGGVVGACGFEEYAY